MEKMKIGWIGTGVMGNAMCSHLIAEGHTLSFSIGHQPKLKILFKKALNGAERLWP